MQPLIESLETRTLCSAAGVLRHGMAGHAVGASLHLLAKSAKPVAVSADPAVTDASVHYQSFSGDPLFATNGPTANDVNQGDLGDCYFLATLAAVAKVNPKRIEQDITSNTDGTYTVKLFSGKSANAVRVTDTLPVFADGTLAYAGLGQDDCTWVAILEKAYATVRTPLDSYASLEGGWMSDAFGVLGIRSCTIYIAANTTAMGRMLQSDAKAHDALTYATGDGIVDDAPLVADHAYSIDSVTVNAKGQLISLTLRNPWGNSQPDDGYITLTGTQAVDNLNGIVVGLV